MTTRPLVVVGAGGFGREVIHIIRAINSVEQTWHLLGVVDDSPSEISLAGLNAAGIPHLGRIDHYASQPRAARLAFVIAIGHPPTRRLVAQRLSQLGYFPSLVHPAASIGATVTLAEGCVVAPGARLSSDITLGAHVHVDQNVTIGHDTRCGAYTRLNPQACISGEVEIGAGVFFGANATALPRIRIGNDVTIGAGAVVVDDVLDGMTVKGVPAR